MSASPDASNWGRTAVPEHGNALSSMVDWFGSGQYAPHGFCLFWDPKLIALYWLGNGGVALAYILIPIMLLYIAWRARQFTAVPIWVLAEFSAFISCCAISHILQIVNLYAGYYWLEAVWLNVTAFVSLITAVTLPFGIAHMVKNAAKATIQRIIRMPEGGD